MKKYFPLVFLILSINSYAQFDSLIFSKLIRVNPEVSGYNSNIHSLGDQNQDGCDDFLIVSYLEQKVYVFYGGNPVDTLPEFGISYPDPNMSVAGILDINDDNIKDIILNSVNEKKFRVYYGGAGLDSIADLEFSHPEGTKIDKFFGATIDFNGDGRTELVMFDAFLRYSNKQFGCYYFYNTGSVFDTIPGYVICGDSVELIRFDNKIDGTGDINGDGKSDFTFYGIMEDGSNRSFRRFYLGNEQWELEPDAEYFKDEHSFNVKHIRIINDLNKDGKDDLLIEDYGFYPYWFKDVILKGSFPIDTMPSWGLNTQNIGLNQLKAVNLGDVNGDGFNDFMAPVYTIYGGLKLWVGARNYPQDNWANKTWLGGGEGLCRDFAAVGDVNGDGVDDIAIAQVPWPPYLWEQPFVFIFSGDTTVKADTVTSVQDWNTEPEGYELYNAYPNPFNPSTVISWYVPVLSQVIIKVFDLLGNEIATLLNQEVPGGKNEIKLYAEKFNLSSGVYLINLKVTKGGNILYSKSQKVTFLK